MTPQETPYANDDAQDQAEVFDEETDDPTQVGVSPERRTFDETPDVEDLTQKAGDKGEEGDLYAEELSDAEVEALKRNVSSLGLQH